MSELEQDELINAILDNSGELPVQVSGISINQEFHAPDDLGWIQIVKISEKLQEQLRMNDLPYQLRRSGSSLLLEVELNGPYSELDLEDYCHIPEDNKLEVLGFSPDKQFALVQTLNRGIGSGCPMGAMFLMDMVNLTADFEHDNEEVF